MAASPSDADGRIEEALNFKYRCLRERSTFSNAQLSRPDGSHRASSSGVRLARFGRTMGKLTCRCLSCDLLQVFVSIVATFRHR